MTNPFSCLESAMGRRKYHRGKRVRITGVQWCLSQVGRIKATFSIVLQQKNTKVSVHPQTGKSLRADFRFLPWNRSLKSI